VRGWRLMDLPTAALANIFQHWLAAPAALAAQRFTFTVFTARLLLVLLRLFSRNDLSSSGHTARDGDGSQRVSLVRSFTWLSPYAFYAFTAQAVSGMAATTAGILPGITRSPVARGVNDFRRKERAVHLCYQHEQLALFRIPHASIAATAPFPVCARL